MQWTELLVTCRECNDRNQIVVPSDNLVLRCRRCSKAFDGIQLTPVHGFVYVLSNPRMPGLLKVGYTQRPVEERAAEVSSGTGIPEPFVIEACFASTDPAVHERTVHESLEQYRLRNREFFVLDLNQCLEILYQIIGRKPCFLRPDLPFETPEEREERLKTEKKREEERRHEKVRSSLPREVLERRAAIEESLKTAKKREKDRVRVKHEEEKARQLAGKIMIVCRACHKTHVLPQRAWKIRACPSCESFEIEWHK